MQSHELATVQLIIQWSPLSTFCSRTHRDRKTKSEPGTSIVHALYLSTSPLGAKDPLKGSSKEAFQLCVCNHKDSRRALLLLARILLWETDANQKVSNMVGRWTRGMGAPFSTFHHLIFGLSFIFLCPFLCSVFASLVIPPFFPFP